MSAKDLIHLALVAGVALAIGIVFAVLLSRLNPTETPPPAQETAPPQYRRVRHTPPPVFDTASFYRTIIDNNLFRPFGWTPPRPTEPYRLIGTILPIDVNTPPRAILQSTAGNKTYIVTTGETLDAETEVVSIAGKHVTLSRNGEQRTLRLPPGVYLNPSPASRSAVRRSPNPTPSAPLPDRPRKPYSGWETREGERIRLGDARLKKGCEIILCKKRLYEVFKTC